jgi:hypothetical protein
VNSAKRWEVGELAERLQRSDVAPATLETLAAMVDRLGGEYEHADAAALRIEAHGWLQRVVRVIEGCRGSALSASRDLLVSAGWLTLLVSNLDADLGRKASAEAFRVAAATIGQEAGNSEIVGWSYELAAWGALTAGDYAAALEAGRAGHAVAGDCRAGMQLLAQQAKALARLGDLTGLQTVLDKGDRLAADLTMPHVRNHFAPEPGKWIYHSMDALRTIGDDERAVEIADQVLAMVDAPAGARPSAMRQAEARITFATAAARAGDLDGAVSYGTAALAAGRQSLPSLSMLAIELRALLQVRWPGQKATTAGYESLVDELVG